MERNRTGALFNFFTDRRTIYIKCLAFVKTNYIATLSRRLFYEKLTPEFVKKCRSLFLFFNYFSFQSAFELYVFFF